MIESATACDLIFAPAGRKSPADGRARRMFAANAPVATTPRAPVIDRGRAAGWPGLMRSAQDGDQRAYADLLRQILPVTRAMVRRRIQDPALADEVVQNVLLTLHRVRHTYDPDRPFLPWLAAIASARAIDQLRSGRRRALHELADEAAMLDHADDLADREGETREAREEVARLLETLPPRQRRALELVKLKELSLAEASAVTGQSVGALKVTIHRALQALRGRRGDAE
jgi:RNA polymerase sigma-70 factor (ECF subfamily)